MSSDIVAVRETEISCEGNRSVTVIRVVAEFVAGLAEDDAILRAFHPRVLWVTWIGCLIRNHVMGVIPFLGEILSAMCASVPLPQERFLLNRFQKVEGT